MNTAYLRGMILFRKSRWEQAAQEFRSALAQDERSAMSHAMLGISHLHLKQYESALREVSAAVQFGPDTAFPYFAMAFVAINGPFMIVPGVSRTDNARSLLQTATAIEPNNPGYWSLLAQVEQTTLNWTACLKAAETGLSYRPLDEECLCFRALALWHLKRRCEAFDVLGVALANHPESPQVHRIQSWISIRRRDRKACIEHLTQSLRIDPSNLKAQLLWRKVNGTPLQKLSILARKCAILFLILYGAAVPMSVISFFGSPDSASSPDILLGLWATCVFGTMFWMLKRIKSSLADPIGFGFSVATIWIFILLCCWMAISTAIGALYHRYEAIPMMQWPRAEIIFLGPPMPLFFLEYALRLRRQLPPVSIFGQANP